MDKKAKVPVWLIWAVVIVAAVYIFAPATFNGIKDKILGGGTAPTPTPSEQRCFIEDTTLTVGPAEEMYNPTTKATTSYHRVFKNGVDKGRYVDGSTITVNPNDAIEIIWAENTTQTTGAGYYAAKQSFTVPCVGEVTAGEAKDSGAYKLYATDGNNLSIKVFNEDNGNLNSASDVETLAAGDQITMDFTIQGTYEDGFSPYGPIVFVIGGNDTTYKDFDLQFTGVNCVETSVPGHYASIDTDKNEWAFACDKDGHGIRSNDKWDGTISLEVESSVNPGATGGDNITISYYDSDYYLNSDSGLEEIGVENNDDGDVGLEPFRTLISID